MLRRGPSARTHQSKSWLVHENCDLSRPHRCNVCHTAWTQSSRATLGRFPGSAPSTHRVGVLIIDFALPFIATVRFKLEGRRPLLRRRPFRVSDYSISQPARNSCAARLPPSHWIARGRGKNSSSLAYPQHEPYSHGGSHYDVHPQPGARPLRASRHRTLRGLLSSLRLGRATRLRDRLMPYQAK